MQVSLFKASGVKGFHVPDRSRFAPPSLSFGDCCLIRNLLVYLVFLYMCASGGVVGFSGNSLVCSVAAVIVFQDCRAIWSPFAL